jgi:hypothetical protein
MRFQRHYTREEARGLLPQVRTWLAELGRLQQEIDRYEQRLTGLSPEGQDVGGPTVNEWMRQLAAAQAVMGEFQRREIVVKDLDRGLIDFPAIIGGREVFLCWESDEEDVEFWHDLESGFGGRERLG